MARYDTAWLDLQYNNRARIPEHPQIFERWARASALAREGLSHRFDVRYGDGPNETLDIYPTHTHRAPVLVYIHGGYWRSLDKRDQSFLAPSFVQAGAMVVMPNYALCPAVRIEDITLQLVRALAWTWRHAPLYGGDASRIVVAGHSAGGHLAAMLLSCDWQAVDAELPPTLVRRALAVSGLFDLEPIRHAPFLQADLRLTEESAQRLSPAGFPAPAGALYAAVGAEESDEFLRQNQMIRDAWGSKAVPVCETVPGTHHLSVLHELADPGARLHALALDLLGVAKR
ncbi:alpha/beta hydrolase [Piscinibacter sp. XHJ-5]|uniref:alpha/beta hydrolase n=1 Tax=Piscinibacter sp. XHJ-5 TaxID=3037797 RepID=UPI00245314DD|nr:alpha/beta hydrolase [Piscinibacter sp. XHJ-5]